MATKIMTAWVDGAVQDIEVEDLGYVVIEPSIEERLDIVETNRSPEFVNNVTLLAEGWTGDASPYSQVVNIDGVTEYSKVDLQPDSEQLTIFRQKDMAFVTENEDGIVTVFCIGQKPTNDYTIQVTITEVIVNE